MNNLPCRKSRRLPDEAGDIVVCVDRENVKDGQNSATSSCKRQPFTATWI